MTRTAIATTLILAVTIGVLLFPVSVSAEQGVRVYGFVFDRTGLPVVNATVTLLLDNVPLPTSSNPATTDLHGYYEFPGIQYNSYCLVAEKYPHSASATIRVQTWDRLQNFTLQGSTADLADVHVIAATPSPTAGLEIATATPAVTETAPGTSATPGFDAGIALLGLFFLGLTKRRKQ
jgi:hypothetical protein